MRVTKEVGLLAGAAAATLVSGVLADTDVSKDELLARLAAAEAKIADLSNANNDKWMNEQRASEVRAIVQDVLADAETRASLLQSGMTGGWDRGFRLRSSDGNYELNVSGQLQVRFVFNHLDDASNAPGATSGTNDYGFENRRTRLVFAGHVVDPSWQYKVQVGYSNAGGGGGLLDAYIKKDFDNGWYMRGGQFKAPFSREELVDNRYQLAAERSLINSLFTGGRTQGIEVGFAQDQFRAMFMLHDGHNGLNTPALGGTLPAAGFNPGTHATEFAVTGRAEFLAQGNWEQFKDFTSQQGSETGFLIGAAFNYEKDESGTAASPNDERWGVTIDGSLEMDGFNAFASFFYADSDQTSLNPWGFTLQGGYYFTDDFEIFARYEYGDLDAGTATDELSVITVGVNKYFHSHNLKWTTDIGFSLEEVNAVYANTGAGYLADNEDSQIVFRTQFQLLF